MLFSVIIPTHNRAALLRDTLNSVVAQIFTDYEIIVVDDGSTDKTHQCLQHFNNLITVITQPNLGPGAARNLGARQSKGDYLAFLDSDDLWFPWTLACFVELIGRHNNPAILAAKLVEFSAESELAVITQTELIADAFEDYFFSCDRGYFVGAGMSVIRRDAFLETGGYTERRINAEDHDLILRMGTARGFVQATSPITLGWRRHGGSATMNIQRTFDGILYLVQQERSGAYPGGVSRAFARRTIVTRHTRSVALACLGQGLRREAWRLYTATVQWHIRLGRWKYLAAFPLKAMLQIRRYS